VKKAILRRRIVAKQKAAQAVIIEPLKSVVKTITVPLRGTSRLVVHRFSEKVKIEIAQKQAKQARDKREARNPHEEFLAARYIDKKGRECFPVTAVKKAIVSAAIAFENVTKVAIRQALFVYPADDRHSDLVPIENHDGMPAVGVMREDAVTIGNGVRGLAYRPAYEEWQGKIDIEYNSRLISEPQLLALIDQAGWGVGICEGRPEKTSALGWGRFERVVT
jgi:hypothetical protein